VEKKIALQLEAGSSFVNKLVVSDPRLPFGALKIAVMVENWRHGIREFVNTKTIWID
jgi:succinate-semialdehyde dehydrogenase/glutarate-semialdehyde dehydrogenase